MASTIFNELQRAESKKTNSRIDIDQTAKEVIKYVMPGRLCGLQNHGQLSDPVKLQIRFKQPAKGLVQLRSGGKVLASRMVNSLPERRVLLPVPNLPETEDLKQLTLTFQSGR